MGSSLSNLMALLHNNSNMASLRAATIRATVVAPNTDSPLTVNRHRATDNLSNKVDISLRDNTAAAVLRLPASIPSSYSSGSTRYGLRTSCGIPRTDDISSCRLM